MTLQLVTNTVAQLGMAVHTYKPRVLKGGSKTNQDFKVISGHIVAWGQPGLRYPVSKLTHNQFLPPPLCLFLSLCLSVCLSFSVSLCFWLSVYLSVCPSVSPSHYRKLQSNSSDGGLASGWVGAVSLATVLDLVGTVSVRDMAAEAAKGATGIWVQGQKFEVWSLEEDHR